MGRRWIVKLDTVEQTQKPLYLGELAMHDHVRDEQGRVLPVTISFASKFVTKREALAAAKAAGYDPAESDEVQAMRTWW